MDIRALSIEGSFEITPRQFPDDRGVFLESFRGDRLAEVIGHRLDIIQTNVSVSSRGTVRGVHFADLPASVTPVLSAKGAAAPSLSQALEQGLLPRYDECVHYYAGLAAGA